MTKDEIMEVCEALARFRPSFMALIQNLTIHDLMFMERSFHRIVLELEKLIGYSGTPTLVWRRTGEIALMGKEFSLLAKWSKEDLLSTKSYIYAVHLA